MTTYRIDVKTGSTTGSVVPDAGWRFTQNLNEVNEAELKFSGTGELKRSLLTIGSTVYIYKDGTLSFKGLIDNTDYFVGGTVVFHASGWEVWLGKENGDYTSSPWSSTASATIFSAIIAESDYFTAGTINTGYTLDYRLSTSSSLFNSISNLANKTGQDIDINYTADTIGVVNHLGSSTSVAVLNEGKEITNLRKSVGYPRGNVIEVFGKGDGDDQIKGTDEDATSIALYGRITKTVIDRTVTSIVEANRLASAELALNKDPPHIYDFDLTNPDYTGLNVGDHINLNALDQDVNNEEVRITGIEEGENVGKQYRTLQVCNPELKTLMRNKNKMLARIQRNAQDDNSYMQGSGNSNTWGSGINAKTSYPLKVGFFLPETFIRDEIGNSNVKEFTVSYDIDAFKSQFGTASFTGSDPQVQNDSGADDPDVENTSGSNTAGVTGDSGNSTAGVTGDSGSEGASVTGTTASSGTASWGSSYSGNSSGSGTGTFTDSSWTTITNTGNSSLHSDLILYFVTIRNDNLTADRDMRVRAYIDGTYFPSSSGTWTRIDSGHTATIPILIPVDIYGDDVYVQAQTQSGDMDYEFTWNYQIIGKHTHSDGSLAASNHDHDDGSYAAASHDHDDGSYAASSHGHSDGTYSAEDHSHTDGTYDVNAADLDHISVNDDVSEAGSVNASSVNLYLDFWSGSAWVNKHSILATGVTIESDVDISDSGTYPDAAGWWRVRVEPITATADFAQGIVKIKNAIDN